MTLGSLFDGAGTACLAAQMCGIEPVWESEIEPFAVEVEKKNFPNAIQYGDITKMDGGKIVPVDIIVGGSPCQGLSVAGKQEGLRDERSVLFYEMIRVIREMREATHGEFPKYVVWENVYGALASQKGFDFYEVVKEFCRIADSGCDVPEPKRRDGKLDWRPCGLVVGMGWSFGWRTVDAQYYLPQRRKRIYAVLDLRDESASEILFERYGVYRNTAEEQESRKGTSLDSETGAGTADSAKCYSIDPYHSNSMKSGNPHSGFHECDKARTLSCNGADPSCNHGGNVIVQSVPCVYDCRGNGDGTVAATLTGAHDNRVTDYSNCVVERGKSYGFDPQRKAESTGFMEEVSATLVNVTCPGCHNGVLDSSFVVRRLTPTECSRLMGFPDGWCDGVKGECDTKKYQLWGNGMALPNVLYFIRRIKEHEEKYDD